MDQISELNSSAVPIVAIDLAAGATGVPTIVMVASERVQPGVTIDTYLDGMRLCSQFEVVERDSQTLGFYDARRLVVSAKALGVSMKQLIYVIKSDRVVWIVLYTAGAEEYEELLPTFEQSIRTFVIRSTD
jgi:hypothetical protein